MSVVDTNVLVHATAPSSPFHAAAQTAISQLTVEGSITITRQVLREYIAVTTRPQAWSMPVPISVAVRATEAFERIFGILEDSADVWRVFKELSKAVAFGGKQVHDANLVATMLAHGETRLLTFNGKHFRRFAPLIEIIEP